MLDEKRVLVCEDDPEIVQEIKTAIEDAFPCATVNIACPWKEVVKTLDDLAHNRIDPYGFVFIDVHHFRDGTKDGPVAYVSDLPFIDRLMSDSSGRVVFFMSAHLTDPKIVELRRRCDKLSQARPMFIEKDLALNFIDEILTWMHSTVHSRRIQELLSKTFGARRRLPVQNSNPAFTRRPRDATAQSARTPRRCSPGCPATLPSTGSTSTMIRSDASEITSRSSKRVRKFA